jgi:uncharacterized protein YfdQ (DUF2303 family)
MRYLTDEKLLRASQQVREARRVIWLTLQQAEALKERAAEHLARAMALLKQSEQRRNGHRR